MPSVWLTALPSGRRSTKVSSRVCLRQLRDPLHRPVERLLLPVGGVRRAVEHVVDALRGQQHAQRAGALRAQRALVHRAARIALDMDAACRSWRRRAARSRRRRTGRCWCRPGPPAPAAGAAFARCVLCAASAITLCAGELARQGPVLEEAGARARDRPRRIFSWHARSRDSPIAATPVAAPHGSHEREHRSARPGAAVSASGHARTGDAHASIDGMVTIVQEGRFQLMDDDGVSHLFMPRPRTAGGARAARAAAAQAGARARALHRAAQR